MQAAASAAKARRLDNMRTFSMGFQNALTQGVYLTPGTLIQTKSFESGSLTGLAPKPRPEFQRWSVPFA